jgi:hypothetical protein
LSLSETFVPEPVEFNPFDLQALRYSNHANNHTPSNPLMARSCLSPKHYNSPTEAIVAVTYYGPQSLSSWKLSCKDYTTMSFWSGILARLASSRPRCAWTMAAGRRRSHWLSETSSKTSDDSISRNTASVFPVFSI